MYTLILFKIFHSTICVKNLIFPILKAFCPVKSVTSIKISLISNYKINLSFAFNFSINQQINRLGNIFKLKSLKKMS